MTDTVTTITCGEIRVGDRLEWNGRIVTVLDVTPSELGGTDTVFILTEEAGKPGRTGSVARTSAPVRRHAPLAELGDINPGDTVRIYHSMLGYTGVENRAVNRVQHLADGDIRLQWSKQGQRDAMHLTGRRTDAAQRVHTS